MKKLGLGIPELADFKANNLIYVDKTEHIYKLIDDGKYYFLSRPRRFGKSLLCSILRYYYDLNYADRFAELFGHTWIGQHAARWHQAS